MVMLITATMKTIFLFCLFVILTAITGKTMAIVLTLSSAGYLFIPSQSCRQGLSYLIRNYR